MQGQVGSGVDALRPINLFAMGQATGSGSATGTGAVTVAGFAHSGNPNRRQPAYLRGTGAVGHIGRTGTTLTVQGVATARGIVSPGGSYGVSGAITETIGTLTVNGDVIFSNYSALEIQYDDTTADALVIAGGLTLTGDTQLIVDRLGTGTTLAPKYDIVHYTGTLSGAFSTITLPAELTDAGYYVAYNEPSSLGAGYQAIALIPEPSTIGLLTLFGLASVYRRRKTRC